MLQHTDADIAAWIALPKRILEASPKAKSNFQHKETGVKLVSIDGGIKFDVWIRENKHLPESFSFGLQRTLPDGTSVVLIRYNGDHGRHENPDGTLIYGPHLHPMTADELNNGLCSPRWNRQPKWAVETNRYRFRPDAEKVFVADTGIVNWGDHFPREQLRIDGMEGIGT